MEKLSNAAFAVSAPMSFIASLTDRMAKLGDGERVLVELLGIISAAIAIPVGLAILRRERYKAQEARMSMCRACQQLNERPGVCQVPVKDRPASCPMKK